MAKVLRKENNFDALRRLYWFVLICALAILGLSLIPGVALFTTALTLGLALFALMAVSGLVFLLLLFLPMVIVPGGRAKIVLFALGCVAAIGLAASGFVAMRLNGDHFVADPIRPAAPLADAAVVDIADAQEDGCGTLCWRLLMGDGVSAVTVSETVAYERLTGGDCARLDSALPADGVCVRVAAAEDFDADVILEIETVKPGAAAKTLFFVPEEAHTLRLKTAAGVIYQDGGVTGRIRTLWPTFALLDQNGAAGFRMAEAYHDRPAPTPLEALASAGIRPGGPPPSQTTVVGTVTVTHAAPRREDRAIVASALGAGLSVNDPDIRADAERYLGAANKKPALDEVDHALIAALSGAQGGTEIPHLGYALSRLPMASIDGLTPAEVYDRAGNGTVDEKLQAVALIAARVLRDPPGTYADEADLYRSIIGDDPDKMFTGLLPLVGRYGFNPIPQLETWMRNEGRFPDETLRAACFAGPEWDEDVIALARKFLDREVATDNGNGAKKEAIRILETRGLTEEANARIDALHFNLPSSGGWRSRTSGRDRAKRDAVREAFRQSVIGLGCDGRPAA